MTANRQRTTRRWHRSCPAIATSLTLAKQRSINVINCFRTSSRHKTTSHFGRVKGLLSLRCPIGQFTVGKRYQHLPHLLQAFCQMTWVFSQDSVCTTTLTSSLRLGGDFHIWHTAGGSPVTVAEREPAQGVVQVWLSDSGSHNWKYVVTLVVQKCGCLQGHMCLDEVFVTPGVGKAIVCLCPKLQLKRQHTSKL